MGRLDFKSSETRSTCLVGSTPTLFRQLDINEYIVKADVPIERDVVLVGGGHAHVEVLRQFAMRSQPGTRLTLISREVNTPYSGMLPGFLAGHYSFDECHIDLAPLCQRTGARLFHNAVTDIDLERRRVVCEGRPPVAFDYLSIDTGSTPDDKDIEGKEYATPIKPVDNFFSSWQSIEEKIVAAKGGFSLVIVGGGAGGVELSLCLRHRIARRDADAARALTITVVSDETNILSRHSNSVRRRLERAMEERGVAIHAGDEVIRITPEHVLCRSGHALACDAVIITTNAQAPEWLRHTGLALDDAGFVRVGRTLQTCSHDFVLAAGDVATFETERIPKNGVYAVRQGPALAENLRALCEGRRPRPFVSQALTLALISTGNQNAIASYGPIAFEGEWVWKVKDFIDRRWMRRYQELPVMESGEDPMRCGGCGAKVSAEILSAVLGEIRRTDPEDVSIGLDTPDDAAVTIPPAGQVVVQSVDQFRSFIADPYVFGHISANHCMSDIYGMGAQPKTAMAMVTLPFAARSVIEQDLRHLLLGALDALDEANVALVGGHTGEGSELSFGLSVTGFADAEGLLRKQGLESGDNIILTKPLGTGALLAGHMRGLVRSDWIDAALVSMMTSNRAAALAFSRHGASACTDITGFGLLGHLGEMLRASGVHADLSVEGIPVLAGARELLADGVTSTLHPANELHRHLLTNGKSLTNGAAVLFDPQTSGGLIAGVRPEQVDDVLAELATNGNSTATVIGTVTDGPAGMATLI